MTKPVCLATNERSPTAEEIQRLADAAGTIDRPTWERLGWSKENWISYWTDVLNERQKSAEEAKRIIVDAGGSIPSATPNTPKVPREEVTHMVGRLRAYNPVEGQEGLRVRDMLLKEAALMIEDIYGSGGIGR